MAVKRSTTVHIGDGVRLEPVSPLGGETRVWLVIDVGGERGMPLQQARTTVVLDDLKQAVVEFEEANRG